MTDAAVPKALALPMLGLGPWAVAPLVDIAALVAARGGTGRSLVVVDGVPGSGKSTFARRLRGALDRAALVPTDDITWHHHPTLWTDEMLDGIVHPWLAGDDVDYRPPGWIEKERAGSVTATGTGVLIVEGVGAARRDLARLASTVVWVDTDPDIAQGRCFARDLQHGENGGTLESIATFHAWWMSYSVPFLLTEEPWSHADLVVDGTSADPDGDAVLVCDRTSSL